MIHDTQRAQISEEQDGIQWIRCAVHHVSKCMSYHKAIVVITETAHCFHNCIYMYTYTYICVCVCILKKYYGGKGKIIIKRNDGKKSSRKNPNIKFQNCFETTYLLLVIHLFMNPFQCCSRINQLHFVPVVQS